MSDRPGPGAIPVEVFFGGCRPDQRTVDLCVEEARLASLRERRIDACAILFEERADETEIRIDVRTDDGEIVVDRFAAALSDEPQLRIALRHGFDRVARGVAAKRRHRGTDRAELPDPTRSVEPPSCIWYG